MKNLSTILTSGAFCLLLLFSFAKIQAQDKAATMDSLMRVYAQYGQFNGSVLVAQKGKIVYEDAFGYANFEWDVPNTIDTRFRLASVSKQFTAMLIMQLVAEGKLALNEPISTYLPDYPKAQADKVRLHHLLTHSSGIPNFTSFPAYRKMMRQPISVEALVATFADSALEFTPGERFAYSNSGYALLGYIIEQVGGQSYEEAMQQRIFEPLGMKNSGYAHNQPIIKKRASGYNQNAGQFTNANHIEMTVPYAAGGLYSTVGDLHLWDQALYGEKLLPAKYRDMMFAEQIEVRGGHYGYGWDINKMGLGKTDQLLPIISHGGGINGFNTLIVRIPSDS
ncbi:MAG: serine hydrolase domain-containing protein, partial [Bacteroidota bacterium]